MEQPPVDISQIPAHTHAPRTITVALDDALTLTVNRLASHFSVNALWKI